MLETSQDFKNAYRYWIMHYKLSKTQLQAYLETHVDAKSLNQAALDLFPVFRTIELEAAAQPRSVGRPAAAARSVEEKHVRRLVSSRGDAPAITAAAPLSSIAVLSAGVILGGLLSYLCLRKRNRNRAVVSIDEVEENLV